MDHFSAAAVPYLSPTAPRTMEPTGRIRKPPAKTVKVLTACAVGEPLGKKSLPISGAKKAYTLCVERKGRVGRMRWMMEMKSREIGI
jgi:hypothetical protein